uniref:Anaphase-promoting complex subunit 4 WD40 domain-containing protein n=1 Tax=Oryza glumipatula TaxID=40148 RepID=A0A0D9YLA9_9ORYZ
MSNPSSPATSTAAGEQQLHDQDHRDEAALQQEHAAAGIIPDDEDKLSPPRCEWEFRLAATVPSPALAGASDSIGSLDFDPTGRHLATGGIARKIRIYRVAEPSSPAACICVPAKLSSVRWRPGGGEAVAASHVGCGDYDGVVTEYDVERGVPVWERDEHEGRRTAAREVRSYSGHVSGRSFVGMGVWRGAGLIASGSESGHVFVYDLRWSKPIWVHPFSHADAFVSAVAWRQLVGDDSDGQLIAGGSDGVLKLFTTHRRLTPDVAGVGDDDVAAC